VLRDLAGAASKPSVFNRAARLAGAGGNGMDETSKMNMQKHQHRLKKRKSRLEAKAAFVANVFASVNVMEPL
jgi:hypothetical protein